MKNYFIWIMFLIFSTLLFSCQNQPTASVDTLPQFSFQLLDSSTIYHSTQFPSGNPVLLVYFDTNCPHCKKETKNLIQHIDSLSHTTICFLTDMPLEDIREYSRSYHLGDYKNIIVGRDYQHEFFKLYRPKLVPHIVIYSSKNKLVKIYKGGAEIQTILAAIVG